jgi:mannosyltransferase
MLDRRRRDSGASRLEWVAYSALFCVGVYVFIYIVLVFATHAVIVASSRVSRGFALRWAGSAAAAFVVALPVLDAAVHQRGQVAFLAGRDTTTPRALLLEPWFVTPPFATVAVALIVLALLVAIAGRGSAVRALGMPRLEVVASAWLLVPAVILLAGHAFEPVYAARYLSSSAPAAALLMALGLDWVVRRRRRALAVGLVAVVACAAPTWVEQRQPFAKNESDFAQVSGIVAEHAEAGDAIAFDESVRPSRRPRLAMHLYPQGFAGLKDVTLDVPYAEGTSWHDSAFDLVEAADLGRLDGVTRLWLVERSAGKRDRAELADLGFTVAASYDTHSSVVHEFVRPAG